MSTPPIEKTLVEKSTPRKTCSRSACLLFILVGSLFLATYLLYKKNGETITTLTLLTQHYQQLQQQLQGAQKAQELTQRELQALQKDWHAPAPSDQDWMLLKARFFLELAQANAFWMDNSQTSIALLQEADNIIKAISSPSLLPIRQSIAKEIAALKTIPSLDIVKIVSRLDKILLIVQRLPLKKPFSTPSIAPSLSKTTWDKTVAALQKVVLVQKQDVKIEPLLHPLYQALLQERIKIWLQEAQWAVLQKNKEMYVQSLGHAQQEIERVFDISKKETQGAVQELLRLQEVPWPSQHLVVDKALQELQHYLEKKASLGGGA